MSNWLAKIVDFLKKIGVLKIGGVSATYSSNNDRPEAFLADDLTYINSKKTEISNASSESQKKPN